MSGAIFNLLWAGTFVLVLSLLAARDVYRRRKARQTFQRRKRIGDVVRASQRAPRRLAFVTPDGAVHVLVETDYGFVVKARQRWSYRGIPAYVARNAWGSYVLWPTPARQGDVVELAAAVEIPEKQMLSTRPEPRR